MHINCRCSLIIIDNFSPLLEETKAAILEYRERHARALGDEAQEWLDWRAFLKDMGATATLDGGH